MIYLLSFVLLVACVKLLLSGASPALAAGLFLTGKLAFALMINGLSAGVMVGAVVVAAIAFAYFWALHRFEDTALWWPVLLGGVFLLA